MFLEWARGESNSRPPQCQCGVITTRLQAQKPRERFELPTCGLQNRRSTRLSHRGMNLKRKPKFKNVSNQI